MKTRKFEYVGGTSKKFWTIDPPMKCGKDWVIVVHYGRIGTMGQSRPKVYNMEFVANDDYYNRIAAKKAKGYTEKDPQPAGNLPPMLSEKPKKPKPAPCKHNNLKRTGNNWKCVACKKVVEFDKPQTESTEVVEKKVRRFINLDWRKTA